MSVQVSYKKQGIFAIVLLLVILVTIEIASTIWWYGQINCEFENNEIFQQMSSSEKYQLCTDLHSIRTSGMELIPDQETQSITINSFGFRGDDFSSNKPENIFRIFMLGGSTMFGYGATSNFTTIPGYFEDILQRNTEFYEIQVINAGIQGADSYDELILLENKILGFDPDMIIVYDGWNDLRSQNTSEDVSNNWNQMCELTQKNNLEILIMLQPIAGFGNKPLTENESKFASVGTDYDGRPLIDSYKKYNKYAESLFELKNCENVFDLRFIFDEIKGPIYWDQGHISDNGNEIVANKMAENIQNILPTNLKTYSNMINQKEVPIDNSSIISYLQNIISFYKTPLLINSVLENVPNQNFLHDSSDHIITSPISKSIFESESKIYEGDKVKVIFEIVTDIDEDKQVLEIKTKNVSKNELIPNVTYFIKILNDERLILSDFFYSSENVLPLEIISNNSNEIQVIGERQYDHNALITNSNSSIMISGPFLESNEIYDLEIELRTIHDSSNWIFSLDKFHVQIQS